MRIRRSAKVANAEGDEKDEGDEHDRGVARLEGAAG